MNLALLLFFCQNHIFKTPFLQFPSSFSLSSCLAITYSLSGLVLHVII